MRSLRPLLDSTVRRVGPATFLAFLVLDAGCTQAADASRATEQAVVGPDEPQARDAGSAPGKAPHIASVRANGTGCPNEGTYDAQISADGASVTFSVRAFDTTVSHGEAFSIEDCTFSVQVDGAAGYAFTLARLDSSGFASLQGAGVNAEESVKYYFQGNPVASESRSRTFAPGDAGAGYTFENAFGGDSAVWSPCGAGRDLNVTSRLVLKNNADKSGYGYVAPSTVKLQLDWRRCG